MNGDANFFNLPFVGNTEMYNIVTADEILKREHSIQI